MYHFFYTIDSWVGDEKVEYYEWYCGKLGGQYRTAYRSGACDVHRECVKKIQDTSDGGSECWDDSECEGACFGADKDEFGGGRNAKAGRCDSAIYEQLNLYQ